MLSLISRICVGKLLWRLPDYIKQPYFSGYSQLSFDFYFILQKKLLLCRLSTYTGELYRYFKILCIEFHTNSSYFGICDKIHRSYLLSILQSVPQVIIQKTVLKFVLMDFTDFYARKSALHSVTRHVIKHQEVVQVKESQMSYELHCYHNI